MMKQCNEGVCLLQVGYERKRGRIVIVMIVLSVLIVLLFLAVIITAVYGKTMRITYILMEGILVVLIVMGVYVVCAGVYSKMADGYVRQKANITTGEIIEFERYRYDHKIGLHGPYDSTYKKALIYMYDADGDIYFGKTEYMDEFAVLLFYPKVGETVIIYYPEGSPQEGKWTGEGNYLLVRNLLIGFCMIFLLAEPYIRYIGNMLLKKQKRAAEILPTDRK